MLLEIDKVCQLRKSVVVVVFFFLERTLWVNIIFEEAFTFVKNSHENKMIIPSNTYRTCAIITRGLYIFYPIFHCSLYCRVVSVTDNLCSN